ncbi:hypothetical protein [Rhizobium sp. 768_B6_N1_8]|uniref:hypothetical protein n=1 Tax=unclassified Rhizobium TaxID=2613769 RepID=UPI003F2311DD
MTTIPPLNLSALAILRDSRHPGYEDAAQDTARRILASYTVNDEAMANALKTISETLFGSGNTSAGEDGSTINGSNNSDKIRSGSRSTVNGGAGDDSIHAGHNSVVKGGAGRDIILGDTETTIDGGDGDDILVSGPDYGVADSPMRGGKGNDVLTVGNDTSADGGDGDDIIIAGCNATIYERLISGGAGNDIITTKYYSAVDGGTGDDRIETGYKSSAKGGSGNDIISSDYESTIEGGKGNDTITATADSTIRFSAGDGEDSIKLRGENNTIALGPGLAAANTIISVSGDKTTITFAGSTDKITVDTRSIRSFAISFADGTTQQIGRPYPVRPAPSSFAQAYAEH